MIRDCSKCGTLTEFAADHKSRQGYWCKACRSRASVESARRHRAAKRANNNAYSARNSANRAEKTAAYKARHPERRAAHQAVQTAVRNGSLNAAPCEVCGAEKAAAHHEDYGRPLSVNWLCHAHHMERHEMLKARES